MLLALFQIAFLATAARGEIVEYWRDMPFERQVRAINPTCMPQEYVQIERNYAFRVIEAAIDQCVTANVTEKQVKKYSYLITRSIADPATASFTVGELSTDGMKCVLKTFVDASDQINDMQKQSLKSAVDGVIAVKDWAGFLLGIPDLASTDKAKATEATISTLLNLRDRMPEAQSFADSVMQAAELGRNYMGDLFLGEREIAMNAVAYNADQCRYADARQYLVKARAAADKECVYAGHSYRQHELNLRRYILNNQSRITSPYIGQGYVKGNSARARYNDLVRYVQEAKETLRGFEQIYRALDQTEEELFNKGRRFFDKQYDYRYQAHQVRASLEGGNVCRAFDKLQSILDQIPPECHPVYFNKKGIGEDMVRPAVLAAELYQVEQRRNAQWWDEADKIAALFRQCKEDEGYARISALQSRINANPIQYAMGGQCKTLASQDLRDRLNAFAPGENCAQTIVPGIEGKKLSVALTMLSKASLLPLGSPVMVDPQSGQAGGIVIVADPAPGDGVTIWTGVALTVTNEPPDAELVSVPQVVGKSETDALTLLASADLAVAVEDSTPADKLDFTPGMVYGASHATGAMVAPQTVVTLNIYGPRPMIEIPGITAPDIPGANSKITAAGFIAGPPALGEPAPDEGGSGAEPGAEPGAVYGTVPPAGSVVEMFSPVQPLVYGPRATGVETRPIPEVLGKPAKVAIGLVTQDGFFSIGSVSPGDPVGEGEKPGTVQTVIPGQGTPQVKGTIVTLRIAMPRVQQAPEIAQENPPETTPDAGSDAGPDAGRGAGRGDSWVGRWTLEAVPGAATKGLDKPMVMDIARIDGKLSLKLFVQKDGAWEDRFTLLMAVDANNVLRTHPDMLREFKRSIKPSQGTNGVMDEVGGKIADTILQLLETLKISRVGNICTLNMTDQKKGPQSIGFSCFKTGPSQQ
ncbi:MAG: hypothetical protein COC12_02585 [Rhodobacteraceae bacterium]|nr:MAG: hypothetical protein COC12_02585 [Paracoccaceae bacterium]